MFRVIVLPSFAVWFDVLPRQVQHQITHMLRMLQAEGPRMSMPWAKKLETQGSMAVFELRPARGASPARVFYGFDVEHAVVVVTGGLKTSAKLYVRGIAEGERAIAERNAQLETQRAEAAGAAKTKGKKR